MSQRQSSTVRFTGRIEEPSYKGLIREGLAQCGFMARHGALFGGFLLLPAPGYNGCAITAIGVHPEVRDG